jgi:hypothetical protein
MIKKFIDRIISFIFKTKSIAEVLVINDHKK